MKKKSTKKRTKKVVPIRKMPEPIGSYTDKVSFMCPVRGMVEEEVMVRVFPATSSPDEKDDEKRS